jgi:hypothetical protein
LPVIARHLCSSLEARASAFVRCRAARLAGAVAAGAVGPDGACADFFFVLADCVFANCSAAELCGALSVGSASDVFLDSVHFERCVAAFWHRCNFTACCAREVSGALQLVGYQDAIIDLCCFADFAPTF